MSRPPPASDSLHNSAAEVEEKDQSTRSTARSESESLAAAPPCTRIHDGGSGEGGGRLAANKKRHRATRPTGTPAVHEAMKAKGECGREERTGMSERHTHTHTRSRTKLKGKNVLSLNRRSGERKTAKRKRKEYQCLTPPLRGGRGAPKDAERHTSNTHITQAQTQSEKEKPKQSSMVWQRAATAQQRSAHEQRRKRKKAAKRERMRRNLNATQCERQQEAPLGQQRKTLGGETERPFHSATQLQTKRGENV